jgi:hypothetical protein
MSANQKPRRVIGYIIIGIVFIVIGVWLWVDGIEAIRTGTIIAGGRKSRPMMGDEAIYYGSAALIIGAYGIWTGFKGKRY